MGTHRDNQELMAAAGGTAAGSGVVPLMERCWTAIGELGTDLYSGREITRTPARRWA